MKPMMLILFVNCWSYAYGQPSYTRIVDSATKHIVGRGISFATDSIYTEFDRDSNIIMKDSARLVYADNRAKKLLKVHEVRSAVNDTVSLDYYFADKKLIKISAGIRSKNRAVVQSFYFKDNKLVFPDNYFSELFHVDDYIDQAKAYLKLKTKHLSLTMEYD